MKPQKPSEWIERRKGAYSEMGDSDEMILLKSFVDFLDALYESDKIWMPYDSKEQWKPIEGFEGYYLVSNMGRVHSIRKKIMLKPNVQHGGYATVVLNAGGKRIQGQLVHRLVAKAFIENPDAKPFVNHKDGHKLNNLAENLEWVTHQENVTHSISIGISRYGSNNPNSMADIEIARRIRSLRKENPKMSVRKIAKMFNLKPLATYRILNGTTWKDLPNS